VRLAAAALIVGCSLLIVPTAGADSISYTVTSGTQGDNGWWRSAVTVQINASPPTTCPTSATFTSSNSLVDCTWGAGNASFHLQFKIDSDPPTVTGAGADRAPDSNGWYTHPVNVTFSGSDSNSGIASCTSGAYSGPDGAGATATGTCTDKAGNVSSAGSLQLKYDSTPPATTATPGRKPNSLGWYSSPVTVTFAGTDATSGIASCTPAARYKGPDNGAVTLTGTCTDQAGNQSSASYAFKYDSTPPQVSDVKTAVAGNAVTVTWQRSRDTSLATVLRAPGRGKQKVSVVYHGRSDQFRDTTVKPGVTYHYTVATTDAAGNDARVKIAASLRQLFAPAPGARVGAGTTLAWMESSSATYYNLQLFLRGKKVLSTWPVKARFTLPRSWTYAGHRHTLAHGTYTWYVWPGLGPRAKAHYGKLLGGSTFTVR